MGKRTSQVLVQRIPAAAIKAGKVPAELTRKGWQGGDKQLREFAALVGKVRRGEIPQAAQKAVLSESVKQLTKGKHGKAWKSFFDKHAGDDLVAVEWAQGLDIAELLAASSLPRIASKAGDKIIIFEFVKLGRSEVAARFHLLDGGAYKGSIVKAIAPLKPLIDGKGGRDTEAQLRMITAGIPQHAQDLLQAALGVPASQLDPSEPVNLEIAMLSSKPEAIRGSGAWAKFPWPKGVDVRKPVSFLNLLG